MAFHSKPRRLNSHKYNFVWYSKTKSQFSLGLNFKLISPKLICCLCGLWNWWRLTGTADGPKKKEDESVFNFQFSMHKILPQLTTTHRVGKTCIVICTAVSYELVKYLKHCLFNMVLYPPPSSMTELGSSQNQCTRHHRFSTSHQVSTPHTFWPSFCFKDSRFYKWNPQVGLQNLLLSFSLGKSNRFHENSTKHCYSLFGNWTSPRSKSEKLTCMIERK